MELTGPVTIEMRATKPDGKQIGLAVTFMPMVVKEHGATPFLEEMNKALIQKLKEDKVIT